MATSIFLIGTNPMGDTTFVRYAATPDLSAFWIWTTGFPTGDDFQADLNANADSLLATAQANSTQSPFAGVDCTVLNKVVKIATLTGLPFNPWCGKNIVACLIDVAGFSGIPSVSIGTNSPNFNDILPITPLTGFNALRKMTNIPLFSGSVGAAIGGSVDVFAKVTTASLSTRYLLLVKPEGSTFV